MSAISGRVCAAGSQVVLLRHALAPGTGDPASFTLGDCTTQRNLSEEGRAQARRIGARFRENGIASAAVFTSPVVPLPGNRCAARSGTGGRFAAPQLLFPESRQSRGANGQPDRLARTATTQHPACAGHAPGQHHRAHRCLPSLRRNGLPTPRGLRTLHRCRQFGNGLVTVERDSGHRQVGMEGPPDGHQTKPAQT